ACLPRKKEKAALKAALSSIWSGTNRQDSRFAELQLPRRGEVQDVPNATRRRLVCRVKKKKAAPKAALSSIWSGKRDSNSRPQPWQGCALPTELFPQWRPLGDSNPCYRRER